MHSQPWAHLVPSVVLTGKKTWHQDHLRKEATHSATGMLACLKRLLGMVLPKHHPHGHWETEPPQGA